MGSRRQKSVRSRAYCVCKNDTTNKKIMYKEEQTMPILTALDWAEFTKKPNDDTFWEYTPEFEALKDTKLDGYVLSPEQKISWLKSSLWAAYKVEKTWNKWWDVWILVFNIVSHNILTSWEIDMNNKIYKECVVYKAWAWVIETPIIEKAPIVKKEPKPKAEDMTKVKTWPESYFLVLILSFLLWIWIINRRLILEKVRK